MKPIFKTDIASALRISVAHLNRLIAAGVIPPAVGRIKHGRLFWYMTPELKAIIRQQRRPERQR
ncbi:hypothetical protein G5Y50_004205 [Escherichia coli]|uniref:hypothetical protein n=1 Tax=Enterobacteriaceae TaxID=543 RepID=UPI00050BDC7D|nr:MULTISPECIES: hypothetical protein [Enterobacteriaceae]AMO51360.1 hypothetical protein AKI40_pA013 [Enterobacter sp. FY-07]EAC0859443.1 hypothetical protein [Escherichia coli]EEW8394473.1 hypothetical protein [Escherichia coli]EEW9202290.1 hypothetical protein [Escherichia coli]EFK5335832.1 hypothetical protein [Escherichia coli]